MCRRASRMLQSSYPSIVPLESDCPAVLEQKWQEWAKQESLKRSAMSGYEIDIGWLS